MKIDAATFEVNVTVRQVSATRATRVRQENHKGYTSKIDMRHKREKCNTNDTIATRMKNFDYDNDTSENLFLHPDICPGTQLGGGGGRPPLPFIENKKKVS